MSDNDEDPLAPWRPNAPWPKKEQILWRKYLSENGDSEHLALKKLKHNSEESFSNVKEELLFRSLELRLVIWLESDNCSSVMTALHNYCACFVETGSLHPKAGLIDLFFGKLTGGFLRVLMDRVLEPFGLGARGKARRALPLVELLLTQTSTLFGDDDIKTIRALLLHHSCLCLLDQADRARPLFRPALRSIAARLAILCADDDAAQKERAEFELTYLVVERDRIFRLPLSQIDQIIERMKVMRNELLPRLLISLDKSANKFGRYGRLTILARENVAICLLALGEFKAARKLFEEVLFDLVATKREKNAEWIAIRNLVASRFLGEVGWEIAAGWESLKRTQRIFELGSSDYFTRYFEERFEHIKALRGADHPDALESFCTYIIVLSNGHAAQEALSRSALEFERRKHAYGEDDPNTIEMLVIHASCHMSLGELREALPLYERALESLPEILGKDDPKTLAALEMYAICLRDLGRAQEALPIFRGILESREQLQDESDECTLETLTNYVACLLDTDLAQESLQFLRRLLDSRVTVPSEKQDDPMLRLICNAMCFQALGECNGAARQYEKFLAHTGRTQRRGRYWRREVSRAIRYIPLLIDSGGSLDWHEGYRAISRCLCEDLDLDTETDAADIRNSFAEFHSAWIDLCLRDAGGTAEIPRILAALQGREMAALLQAELEAKLGDFPRSDIRREYLELTVRIRETRMALRMLKNGNGIVWKGDYKSDGQLFGIPSPKDATQTGIASQRELEDDLIDLTNAWRTLRERIGMKFKDFHLSFAPADVSIATLASSLSAEEALVLLFTHTKKEGAATHYACLVSADGAVRVERLDDLAAVTIDRHIVNARGAMRGPLRGFAPEQFALDLIALDKEADEATIDRSMPLPLEERFKEALWAPLCAALPGVRRWRIATHQTIHVLPVHLGADPDHEVTVLPGLFFFLRSKRTEPTYSSPRFAVHIDAARETDEPIPFVNAEAALIDFIWSAVRPSKSEIVAHGDLIQYLWCAKRSHKLPLRTSGAATLELLRKPDPAFDAIVFAAHGYALGEPPQIVVDLKREKALHLNAADVLGTHQRPCAVLMSSCVAGRVNEDSDGEPLGLVSTFLLRGADFVIAPLKPIPDFYAPIFAGLFHLAWFETGDPTVAFRTARRQALVGDWPDGFEELLRLFYASVMEDILRNATPDDKTLIRKLNAWSLPMSIHPLQDFIKEYCTTKEMRDVIIEKTLDRLIARCRGPNHELQYIVRWTVKFG